MTATRCRRAPPGSAPRSAPPIARAAAAALALALPALRAQAQDPAPRPPVLTGADVLERGGTDVLAGRAVGLITNHTGRTLAGLRTVDVIARLAKEGHTKLVALFSPEHGWEGKVDEKTGDTTDAATGLRVWSLYGETRRPTDPMLAGVDTLVFDIQDVGCRFYTYLSTMRNGLEAAAQRGLRFVVLDRPNPIGGVRMEGPVMAAERADFVGAHRIPVRHGLTAGELARMIAGEDGLRVDLHVVRCEGWQRADLFDATGQEWVSPSPNMRALVQALLYPGVGLLEGTNLSVGRGTDRPFEVLGAPWCDGVRLAAILRAAKLPGVAFVPVAFTPTASRFRGERCAGVHVFVTDWKTFEPVRTGIHLACALRAFGNAWDTGKLDWLLKHEPTRDAILGGAPPDTIVAGWQKELDLFRIRRKPFLLYE